MLLLNACIVEVTLFVLGLFGFMCNILSFSVFEYEQRDMVPIPLQRKGGMIRSKTKSTFVVMALACGKVVGVCSVVCAGLGTVQ